MAYNLKETQTHFCHNLLENTALPSGLLSPESVPERMEIYRNTVYGVAGAALASQFPIVQQLVGEGFFTYVAHEYTRAHPPKIANLDWIGERLAAFLGARPELGQELPYLPDVARMEWHLHRSYMAANSKPVDIAALQRIPPEEYGDLRFSLHPSLFLQASPYPLYRIWRVHQPDYGAEKTVDIGAGGFFLAIWRDSQYRVIIEEVTKADFYFLEKLQAGKTLEEACEVAAAQDENWDAGRALARAVRVFICDFIALASPA